MILPKLGNGFKCNVVISTYLKIIVHEKLIYVHFMYALFTFLLPFFGVHSQNVKNATLI